MGKILAADDKHDKHKETFLFREELQILVGLSICLYEMSPASQKRAASLSSKRSEVEMT